MCVGPFKPKAPNITIPPPAVVPEEEAAKESRRRICLLYTSDAADE